MVIPTSNLTTSTAGNPSAHTNLRIIAMPAAKGAQPQAAGSPPFAGYFYETPASFACLYSEYPGHDRSCNPNVVTANPTGGSGVIAIVDAYDDPTAAADLAVFSKQFGLPPVNFSVVYAGGKQPAQDPSGGWEIEESLDVQWAHAMAPNAQIILVEAASNYFSDLLAAVQVASTLVAKGGGGDVSMSWGGEEFSQETLLESYFATPGVVYFASSGDGPGTIYPSVSPSVIAAGGTSIVRDPNRGGFIAETAWQDGGGGSSAYFPRPRFQDALCDLIGNARAVPDISLEANPTSGVWIYDGSGAGGAEVGWYVIGGTSVASPSLAGITNATGTLRKSSDAQNTYFYQHPYIFRDITYGNCGVYNSSFAGYGWDACTGNGSPLLIVPSH